MIGWQMRSREIGTAAMRGLEVYVTRHCFGCAEALRLADLANRRFPELVVKVIDLEREPEARPDRLVAVPTYVLDGQILSLGNPRPHDLFRQLEQALARRCGRAEVPHDPA
jgi:hypothetical protein